MNINNPIDFAKLTNQSAEELRKTQQAIAGLNDMFLTFSRDRAVWNIQESTYTPAKKSGRAPMKFHTFASASDFIGSVARVTDSGGRRKVATELIYQDGQFLDDQGRKGEQFDFEIMLHGSGYMKAMKDLITILQYPIPGTLLHPVRGNISCAMSDYTLVHESISNNAVLLSVRFMEHTNGSGMFRDIVSVSSKLSKVMSALKKIAEVAKTIAGAIQAVRGIIKFAVAVVQTIKDRFEAFTELFRGFAVEANGAFNKGASPSLAGITPTETGGNAVKSSRLTTTATAGINTSRASLSGGYATQGDKFRTSVSIGDPLSAVPRDLLTDSGRQALTIKDLEIRLKYLREYAAETVEIVDAAGLSIELNDQLFTMKECLIAATEVMEQGAKSSKARVLRYVVPRIMSVREAAFLNNVSPDSVQDIEILNPELLSMNYIAKDTVLLIPVSA